MIRLLTLSILVISLFGCASKPEVITEYRASIVPVDCLNQKNITDWLSRMISVANEQGSNADAIKYKLWQIRSSCQSF